MHFFRLYAFIVLIFLRITTSSFTNDTTKSTLHVVQNYTALHDILYNPLPGTLTGVIEVHITDSIIFPSDEPLLTFNQPNVSSLLIVCESSEIKLSCRPTCFEVVNVTNVSIIGCTLYGGGVQVLCLHDENCIESYVYLRNGIIDPRNFSRGINIQSMSNVIIQNMTFRNGKVAIGEFGGCVHAANLRSTFFMADTTFEFCSSVGQGGGLFVTGNTSFVDVETYVPHRGQVIIFRTNFRLCESKFGKGGASNLRALYNVTLANVTVTNCSALYNGGGLSINDISAGVFGTNVTLQRCFVSAPDNDGGCLSVLSWSNVILNDIFLEQCSTKSDGGCIRITGAPEAHLINVVAKNCSSFQSGGALYFSDVATVFIRNVLIVNAYANISGGCIEFTSSQVVSFDNVTLTRCTSSRTSNCINFFAKREIELRTVTMSNFFLDSCLRNTDGYISSDDSAIAIRGNATVVRISSSRISNAYGGCLSVQSATSSMIVSNSTLINCGKGLGMSFQGSALQLVNVGIERRDTLVPSQSAPDCLSVTIAKPNSQTTNLFISQGLTMIGCFGETVYSKIYQFPVNEFNSTEEKITDWNFTVIKPPPPPPLLPPPPPVLLRSTRSSPITKELNAAQRVLEFLSILTPELSVSSQSLMYMVSMKCLLDASDKDDRVARSSSSSLGYFILGETDDADQSNDTVGMALWTLAGVALVHIIQVFIALIMSKVQSQPLQAVFQKVSYPKMALRYQIVQIVPMCACAMQSMSSTVEAVSWLSFILVIASVGVIHVYAVRGLGMKFILSISKPDSTVTHSVWFRWLVERGVWGPPQAECLAGGIVGKYRTYHFVAMEGGNDTEMDAQVMKPRFYVRAHTLFWILLGQALLTAVLSSASIRHGTSCDVAIGLVSTTSFLLGLYHVYADPMRARLVSFVRGGRLFLFSVIGVVTVIDNTSNGIRSVVCVVYVVLGYVELCVSSFILQAVLARLHGGPTKHLHGETANGDGSSALESKLGDPLMYSAPAEVEMRSDIEL
eukprot:PhF_6_TR29414/c0_g1_i2/m.43469